MSDVDWMREELADAFSWDGPWDDKCERATAIYVARNKHKLVKDRTFDQIDGADETPPRTNFLAAIAKRVSRARIDNAKSHTVRHRATIRTPALELEAKGIEVIPEKGSIVVDGAEWEIMSILGKPDGFDKPVYFEIELVRDAGK